jgi:hypothetical protein
MKPRHAAALALVGWYLLSPLTLLAQNATKAFTADDRTFTFRYWDQLIDCEQNKDRDDCSSYQGVCDELIAHEQHTRSIACFAYPRDRFKNTPTFQAATFSVEIVENLNEKSCLVGPTDGETKERSTTTIQGVRFAVFEFGEGEMNQDTSGEAYRTFHRGKCYQLGVNTATIKAGVFDPPVRDLTDADWDEIQKRLEQARKSFLFLK